MQREDGNEHDQFAVALLFQERTVGHVPKDLRKYMCAIIVIIVVLQRVILGGNFISYTKKCPPYRVSALSHIKVVIQITIRLKNTFVRIDVRSIIVDI